MLDTSKVRRLYKELIDTNFELEKTVQRVFGENASLTTMEKKLLDKLIFVCQDCGYWTSREIIYVREGKQMCYLCAADYDIRREHGGN